MTSQNWIRTSSRTTVTGIELRLLLQLSRCTQMGNISRLATVPLTLELNSIARRWGAAIENAGAVWILWVTHDTTTNLPTLCRLKDLEEVRKSVLQSFGGSWPLMCVRERFLQCARESRNAPMVVTVPSRRLPKGWVFDVPPRESETSWSSSMR